MKNKIILSLITVIFLSSCANKFSLTKRKYTKGYYFASSGNKTSNTKENEHKNLLVKNLPAKKTTLPAPETGNIDIKETAVVTFYKPETLKQKNKVQQQETHQHVTASAEHKKDIAVKPLIKQLSNKPETTNTTQKASDADLNLVIMVILCLFPFINLIPVYLHDGKKLTLNFLITLLLDFTWILGVIFALLVIFDVIDLK